MIELLEWLKQAEAALITCSNPEEFKKRIEEQQKRIKKYATV